MTQTTAPNTRIRLVIDVEYPAGAPAGSLISDLTAQLDSAVGSGLLNSSAGKHLPETWDARITPALDEIRPPGEGVIANWLSGQIEDGNLLLEDIPQRLERYGLMGPQDFLAELQERMGTAFDE